MLNDALCLKSIWGFLWNSFELCSFGISWYAFVIALPSVSIPSGQGFIWYSFYEFGMPIGTPVGILFRDGLFKSRSFKDSSKPQSLKDSLVLFFSQIDSDSIWLQGLSSSVQFQLIFHLFE